MKVFIAFLVAVLASASGFAQEKDRQIPSGF